MADVFEVLGAPARQAIFDELVEGNRQILFEICARWAMKYNQLPARQAASQHLAVLEAARLTATPRFTFSTRPRLGIPL